MMVEGLALELRGGRADGSFKANDDAAQGGALALDLRGGARVAASRWTNVQGSRAGRG
jgi:hypothetical protein